MYVDIVRLTVRQSFTRPRMITLGLVMAIPPFLGFLYAFSDSNAAPVRAMVDICDGLVLVLVLPLLALVFGSAAFGNEVEDGTIIYLVMKPAPRWRIVLSKLLPLIVVIATLSSLSIMLTTLLVGREGDVWQVGLAFVAASVVGAVAYGAIFLLLGLVTTRTLVVGLIYIFLWEGALTGFFRGLRFLSVREFARSVARVAGDINPRILDTRVDAPEALLATAGVAAVAFALATLRLRAMDVE